MNKVLTEEQIGDLMGVLAKYVHYSTPAPITTEESNILERGCCLLLAERTEMQKRIAGMERDAGILTGWYREYSRELSGAHMFVKPEADYDDAMSAGHDIRSTVHDMRVRINGLFEKNRELTAALAELVDLKDNVKQTDPSDYEERKPLAWEEARRVLKGGGE